MNFLCSWSGGKDSCYAFYKAVALGYKPTLLLNVMNETGERSRSHGISKEILQAQASALGVPIHFFNSTWEAYETNYIKNLKLLTETYSLSHAVFGDIDIEAHKQWEEKVSGAANLKAVLPLWQGNRRQLVLDMITAGIEAIIVSCNQDLGEAFLGKTIDIALVETLEAMGIDACGENGEFHTLVVNAPFFKNRIDVQVQKKESHKDYYFANLRLIS
ncbi:Dph6-related ATP pyrophosphatase [Aestuariivivens insulae]|uniref:Dph6-related ATP pyrophosphatase n=1 Tax=Aestuariivivens insulae TaxID=1621988 RepID=UPI001F5A1A3E|nr:diphthine--ammonia ligase [Aestuariivivens insulae]